VDGAGDSTQKLLAALAHPTRRQILREMMVGGGPPRSPRQVSVELDETLSNVSYHFRVLAEAGVIELVSTRPVRGSTQHFYGVSLDAEWARSLLALEGRGEANGAREMRTNGDRLGEEIT
jgi:DNA-binding transcriptional ArsR family regulator